MSCKNRAQASSALHQFTKRYPQVPKRVRANARSFAKIQEQMQERNCRRPQEKAQIEAQQSRLEISISENPDEQGGMHEESCRQEEIRVFQKHAHPDYDDNLENCFQKNADKINQKKNAQNTNSQKNNADATNEKPSTKTNQKSETNKTPGKPPDSAVKAKVPAKLTEAKKGLTNFNNQDNDASKLDVLARFSREDFSYVTEKLTTIVQHLQKEILTVDKVPSEMIKPKVKPFFKKPNQNDNKKNRSANDKNKVQSGMGAKRQSNSSCTNKGSIHSRNSNCSNNSRNDIQSSSSRSCPKVDIVKKLREEVQAAMRSGKTFTICGRPQLSGLRKALVDRGWVEKYHPTTRQQLPEKLRTYSTYLLPQLITLLRQDASNAGYRNLVKSKLLENHQVDFFWGYGRDAFRTNPDKVKLTVINRLKKDMYSYANKEGLSQGNDVCYWYQISNVSKFNHPRTYALSQQSEMREFVEDFRRTAAMALLKWVVKIHETKECKIVSPTGKIPLEAFDFALNECCKLVKKGRHEDIDELIPEAKPDEWTQFLDYFYKIVHYNNHFKSEGKETEDSLVRKSKYVLKNLANFYSSLNADGMMNIWILKPVYNSMGRGIHVCSTLENVLSVVRERSNIRHIVQKYIGKLEICRGLVSNSKIVERPLLIYNTKFDIRQWFLISSCTPLTIWMYKECYLRFSSQTYNLRKLHESVHLTNNSVQCRYKTVSADSALPNHNMWDSIEFENYLSNIGYPDAFKDIIYPGMKQSIIASVLIHQDKMIVRRNCFELYGADFMVGEDFRPWMIETNSCPALYASTPVTAKMCPKVLEDLVKVVIDHAKDSKAPTGNFELIYKQKPTKIPNHSSFEVMGLSLKKSYFFRPSDEDVGLSSGEASSRRNGAKDVESLKNAVVPYKKQSLAEDSMKKFSKNVRRSLKNLLQIIQSEKKKRGL